MKKSLLLTTLLFLLFACQASAQTSDSLRQQIEKIVSSKNAIVGISIIGNNGEDTLSLNRDRHFPMQSVFKFHIALAVLSQIDQGKFSFNQKIKILKKDLLSNLYSPIRENYPNGVTLTISKFWNIQFQQATM